MTYKATPWLYFEPHFIFFFTNTLSKTEYSGKILQKILCVFVYTICQSAWPLRRQRKLPACGICCDCVMACVCVRSDWSGSIVACHGGNSSGSNGLWQNLLVWKKIESSVKGSRVRKWPIRKMKSNFLFPQQPPGKQEGHTHDKNFFRQVLFK